MNINQGSYLKKIIKRGVTLLIIGTLLVPNVPMNVQAEASGDVDGSAGVASSTEVGGVQTDELGNRIVTETDTDTEDSTDTQNATGSDSQVTEEVTTESEDAVVSEESGSVDGAEVSDGTTEDNSDTGLENSGDDSSEAGTEALVENENVSMDVNSETATSVVLDSTTFPDEKFRNYIAKTYDKDGISGLSVTEINSANSIDITSSGITSVKGIEFLSELKYLDIANNSLETLDLSKNKKLEALECSLNKLTSIDLSANTELRYIRLVANSITSLNLSNNTKIRYLYCNKNKLTTLDVSTLIELEELDVGYNNLTELNISKNIKLKDLCINATKITKMDFSNNLELTDFGCSYTDMTSIDLRNNNLMESLICEDSDVATIQWGDMSNYLTVNLNSTKIDNLDVSQCPKLSILFCENNNLTSLYVSKCTKLLDLRCSNNNLTELDVSNNTLLNELQCSNNKISKLELPNQKQLYDLYCDSNNLVSLDLSNTDVRRGNYQANRRELSADKDGYVDLSVLEADGFDITKASDWSNVVEVNTEAKKIKVDFSASTTKPKQVEVTYSYNINNTYLAADQKFILQITQYRTNIADAVIEMNDPEYYWGLGLDGVRRITYNGQELIYGRDFIVEGGGTNINVGTATVAIKGVNDFTGSVTKTFQILPSPISDANLISVGDQTYNGTAITPDVSLKLNYMTYFNQNYLEKDKDYVLSYENNTSVGTATVTITGKGNYKGEITTTFKINPSNIAAGRIDDIPNQPYTGSEVKPGITVTANKTSLVNGTDYDLSYSNNVNLGTATVTATGKGNYTGSISKTYKIAIATVSNLRNSKSTTTSIKLKWDKASGVSGYEIYSCKTGSKKFTKLTTIKKASTTTYTNKKLKIGTAYSYKIRAYKTINGKKQYGEYTEVLNTTTSMAKPVVKLSAGSKKATITYQKVSGANGYEIYMSTSKKGTYENIKTLTKASKIKYTKTGLKKKKTYYFKVRAYKIVNGEKVYSSYSTVKKVKVK